MLKVIEAFAGIGTQRMGLERAGIEHEVVAIFEINKQAIKSYEAIHGQVKNLGDISKVDPKDIPDCDLFTYSFPCQDISACGLRKGLARGSKTRSSLLWECEKVIEAKRPKYLLMENVAALLWNENKPHFLEWLAILRELGYSNFYKVLNAKDYGVAQSRERVFCVSILDCERDYVFPPSTVKNLSQLSDILIENPTKKNFLNKDMAKTFKPLKDLPGGDVLTVGEIDYSRNSLARVVSPQGISGCVVARTDAYNAGVKVLTGWRGKEPQIRILTSLECWRLMGIKDEDYYKAKKVVSDTQLYKQAGNAIVVNVLEAIFRQLFFPDKTLMEARQLTLEEYLTGNQKIERTGAIKPLFYS